MSQVELVDQPNIVTVTESVVTVQVAPQGLRGPQGVQGIPGVVAATAPITYDSGTQTVAIDPTGYVASVNTQTGAVVLGAADVGAYPDTNPSSFVDAAGAAAAAPVQSVNTQTGAVTLGASDVGAVPTSRQVLTSGTGLSGGGDLTADRTITLDPSALAGDAAFAALGAIPTGGATGQVLAKVSGTNYDTVWGPLGMPFPNTLTSPPSGTWISNGTGAYTTEAVSSANTFVVPFFVSVTRTFDRIAIHITTAGAGGSTVRLGIYNTDGGNPTTVLYNSAAIAADTTGTKEDTINITLTPGLYALAYYQSGLMTTRRFPLANAPSIRAQPGDVRAAQAWTQNNDFASPFGGAVNAGLGTVPAIFLRVA
jgi:hypothetical protein